MACIWSHWMILSFVVSGSSCLVLVHQPPVLAAALDRDVVLPCELNLSDVKLQHAPVLYWTYLRGDNQDRVWQPSEKYQGRVEGLDKNDTSSNKSVLFKNVQWADSGEYLCKLSITTVKNERFRRLGNITTLLVYDTISFHLTNNSGICEVKVTKDPRFVLSIHLDGKKLQTFDSSPGERADQPHITLSQSTSALSIGKYECRLYLDEDVIASRIVHHCLHECKDGEKDLRSTKEEQYPEPWCLYGALLIVPLTALLGVTTGLLLRRG